MPVSNPTPTGKATASRARNGAAESSRAESPRAASPRAASPRPAASRRAAHDPTSAATSAPATGVTAVTGTTGGAGRPGAPAKKAAPQKKAAQKKAAAPRKAAAPARKAAAAKSAPAKTAPVESAVPAGTPTTARRSPARRTGRSAAAAAGRSSVGSRTAAPPGELAVREDESPWTAAELAEVQAELESDVLRLRAEITVAEHDLAGLMRDAGDGAGDDQADAGTATFEREQEISLANNSREMLDQSEHALERIALGTYGICESCANPVGKLRLQAFPRATLCRSCKQKQERR